MIVCVVFNPLAELNILIMYSISSLYNSDDDDDDIVQSPTSDWLALTLMNRPHRSAI